MPVRKADATWNGDLRDGEGTMAVESGAYEGAFSYGTRFGDDPGTNPEELIAAAHAGCFSMAFANELDDAGHTPESVSTEASVYLEDGAITRVHLDCEAAVPDVDEGAFQEIAEGAKEGCPVSQALAAVDEITLDATLA
ncbi:MAG: OsmC family protein [Halobacteriaceae archaeon]